MRCIGTPLLLDIYASYARSFDFFFFYNFSLINYKMVILIYRWIIRGWGFSNRYAFYKPNEAFAQKVSKHVNYINYKKWNILYMAYSWLIQFFLILEYKYLNAKFILALCSYKMSTRHSTKINGISKKTRQGHIWIYVSISVEIRIQIIRISGLFESNGSDASVSDIRIIRIVRIIRIWSFGFEYPDVRIFG